MAKINFWNQIGKPTLMFIGFATLAFAFVFVIIAAFYGVEAAGTGIGALFGLN